MAITKFSNSTLKTPNRYNDFLAGNTAYDPGGYWPIASANGTGSSGTITFSSIPGTYKHLQIRGIMRSSDTATVGTVGIRMNGASGTSYAWHYLTGDGGAVGASGVASTAQIVVGQGTAASSSANTMGVLIADILDYTSTSVNKTLRYLGGNDQNGSGTIYVGSGVYLATTAITSLDIILTTAGKFFTTQTTFELYGIKEV